MQNIPSVDSFRTLLERKQKFVNEIGSAFEDIGFVALKGHFYDKLVNELYGEIRNFFALPLETNTAMRFQVLRSERLCFLEQNMLRKKEGI
jgi:isopenicillin N synthase-like dioxygenase